MISRGEDSETKEYEIKVKFIISNFDCDPEEVTSILNILPSKTWLKGDRVHSKARNTHKQNGWQIESGCPIENTPLDIHIVNLYQTLEPCIANLEKLSDDVDIEILCVVYGYKYIPELYISPKSLTFLSKLKVGISFDIYDLQEE